MSTCVMMLGVTQIKLDLIIQATVKDENLQVLKSVIMRGWPVTKKKCTFMYLSLLGFSR